MSLLGSSRVHGRGWREAIGIALDAIGPTMRDRLGHVRFVAGVDPVFAGVHAFATTKDGRSYRDTAACCYPFHLLGPADRRVTTIVLPGKARQRPSDAFVIVHELGHALDELTGFEHVAKPVTEYAKTDRYEAFAEAFTSWIWPTKSYARPDAASVALFRSAVYA